MIRCEIVIPCFNEESNLGRLWVECLANVEESNGEIAFIIVDNGSTDNTSQFVSSHSGLSPNVRFIRIFPNNGYGGGILAGLGQTSAPFIGWTHADLQTPLSDCLRGKNFLESGFEFTKGRRVGRPLSDRFFSLGMGILATLLFQKHLREINAQPTIMTRSSYVSWLNPPNDFSLDLYALVMAKKQKLSISRFPVDFPPRYYGASKWNTGVVSRVKFAKRTLVYSLSLRKSI
jgi:glycosyltransferase involved in cell wall biosynthesis